MKLATLYTQDRTAWLEENARLIRLRRDKDVDYRNLAVYLKYWARRDRQDVKSRLTRVLTRRLKWDYQPSGRSRKNGSFLLRQADDLEDWVDTETLRRYAEDSLESAYEEAVRRAARQTGSRRTRFPRRCPYTIDELLGDRTYKILLKDRKGER